jgi:aminomethyltransferase
LSIHHLLGSGDDVILAQLSKQSPPRKRRVGLSNFGGRPFRGGAVLLTSDSDAIVGNVTSGVPSPSLPPGTNVGMGYVQPKFAKPGTELMVRVGKELMPVKVSKMPFVPTKYFV